MLRKIKSYLTLKRIGYAFSDSVSGKAVYYYEDCYGDVYMKDNRWSTFAVRRRSLK